MDVSICSIMSFGRLKRSVLSHPLKPLPLTLSWLLRSVVSEWTAPSVSEINQQIELNRAREKWKKSQTIQLIPNSFSNYKLYIPREEVGNIEEGEERDTGGEENTEHGEDGLDFHAAPRIAPRPVVMTWKQRQKENTRLTAKLVGQKRAAEGKDNARFQSYITDGNQNYNNYNDDNIQGEDVIAVANDIDDNDNDDNGNGNGNGNDNDNGNAGIANGVDKATRSQAKKRRRSVLMKKTASSEQDSPLLSSRSNRKSARLSEVRRNTSTSTSSSTFHMPPGESEVSFNAS